MGDLWFTTLSGVRRAEPAWPEIAHYAEPLRRYLGRFHAAIPEADRDDIAQEVLLAMRERLVGAYDAARGRFRDYLKGAIENKVRDFVRARRRAAARAEPGAESGADREPEAPAVAADDVAAVDLEAELLRAVRVFHDAHTGGPDEDLEVVWCFADRLVRGLPEAEIAAREGLSRDRVKRLLARARDEVLREVAGGVLAREGGPPPGDRERARVAELVREGLRRPRERARILERAGEPRLAAAADDILLAVDATATRATDELRRGLEEVLAP